MSDSEHPSRTHYIYVDATDGGEVDMEQVLADAGITLLPVPGGRTTIHVFNGPVDGRGVALGSGPVVNIFQPTPST